MANHFEAPDVYLVTLEHKAIIFSTSKWRYIHANIDISEKNCHFVMLFLLTKMPKISRGNYCTVEILLFDFRL